MENLTESLDLQVMNVPTTMSLSLQLSLQLLAKLQQEGAWM
jgi:hypothetical protein